MSDPGSLRNLAYELERGALPTLAQCSELASVLRGAAKRIEQLEAGLRRVEANSLAYLFGYFDEGPESDLAAMVKRDRELARALLDEQGTPDMTRASLEQKEQPNG